MAKTTTIKDDDVFALTDKGNRELKTSGTRLSVADLQVLVLVDGFSPVAAIAERIPGAAGKDVREGILNLAKMRQHPVLKHMPVIMLTAEATREAVLKGLERGADGYVTKPFEADLLVNAVKAVLGFEDLPETK